MFLQVTLYINSNQHDSMKTLCFILSETEPNWHPSNTIITHQHRRAMHSVILSQQFHPPHSVHLSVMLKGSHCLLTPKNMVKFHWGYPKEGTK